MYNCLAKDRTQRYDQPSELLQDIQCLQQGQALLHASGVDLTRRNPLRAAGGNKQNEDEARRRLPQRRIRSSGNWWGNLPVGLRRMLVLVCCAVWW